MSDNPKIKSATRVINMAVNNGALLDSELIKSRKRDNHKRYEPQSKFEFEDKKGWVKWGEDNLYPQYLNFLYKNEGLHKAIIDGKTAMMTGKGCGIPAVDKLLSKIFFNLNKQAFAVIELIWSKDGLEVADARVLSSSSIRFKWDIDNFEICGVYYSKDWTQVGKAKGKPIEIPLYNPLNVRSVDQDGNSVVAQPTQALLVMREPEDGHYYNDAPYSGGINWIEVARQCGEFHRNNLENGLFPSMMITYKGDLTNEEMDAVEAGLTQQLQGASSTGKYVLNFTDIDGAIEFTPITTNEADKLYEWQVEAAQNNILQAHGVTTPLLFGIRTSTGFGGNKDEMVIGEKMFMENVIRPEQKLVEEALRPVFGAFTIQPKGSIFESEANANANAGATTDVASLALNGAQIESLVNIILQVATGALPVESGKAVVAAGFPMLTADQIANIFSGIIPGSTSKEEVLSAVKMALQSDKKKALTDEEGAKIAAALIALGEDVPEDFIALDEYEVDYESDDADLFVSTGTARPNARSAQDKTIDGVTFYARYVYDGAVGANTRQFCRKMIDAGKVYRKEDIMAMGDKAVNAGWGPRGADTYSVWLYKGGGNCGHTWKKIIYVSAKDLGIDVNNPNAKKIAESKAKEKGFTVRNNRLVTVPPKNMPRNGFLPKD